MARYPIKNSKKLESGHLRRGNVEAVNEGVFHQGRNLETNVVGRCDLGDHLISKQIGKRPTMGYDSKLLTDLVFMMFICITRDGIHTNGIH